MLIGHQKQWQFLKKSFALGKTSHAYLFEGQKKLGKKTLAIELGKWILQEDISKRQHPDYIFIEPQKKEIQIDQIRDFIWRLSLKSPSGGMKLAIIDQAHCLNEEAQNCLLKTLEEPKGNTMIILVSEYPQLLFPTIFSRCEPVKFYPVDKEEIRKYLKTIGIPEKEREEIIEISMGRPGVAIDLALSPQKLAEQRKIIKDLLKISSLPIAGRFQYLKDIVFDNEGVDPVRGQRGVVEAQTSNGVKEILDTWLWYFRNEFLGVVTAGQEMVRPKTTDGLKRKPVPELRRILKLIQETSFLISRTNINLKLALETLVIEF